MKRESRGEMEPGEEGVRWGEGTRCTGVPSRGGNFVNQVGIVSKKRVMKALFRVMPMWKKTRRH